MAREIEEIEAAAERLEAAFDEARDVASASALTDAILRIVDSRIERVVAEIWVATLMGVGITLGGVWLLLRWLVA